MRRELEAEIDARAAEIETRSGEAEATEAAMLRMRGELEVEAAEAARLRGDNQRLLAAVAEAEAEAEAGAEAEATGGGGGGVVTCTRSPRVHSESGSTPRISTPERAPSWWTARSCGFSRACTETPHAERCGYQVWVRKMATGRGCGARLRAGERQPGSSSR